MTGELIRRLTSLGRAHDLVRPLPGAQGKAALLGDLLAVLLAPYEDTGAFAGRIRVAVPRMGVGERTATTLALVIHELATNSLKHGALSTRHRDPRHLRQHRGGGGRSRLGRDRRAGGRPVPEMAGFGSRMILRSVASQLGGLDRLRLAAHRAGRHPGHAQGPDGTVIGGHCEAAP